MKKKAGLFFSFFLGGKKFIELWLLLLLLFMEIASRDWVNGWKSFFGSRVRLRIIPVKVLIFGLNGTENFVDGFA